MPCLTRETMSQPRELPRIRVDLPELGQDVYVWVHGLTHLERERLRARFRGPDRQQLLQKFDGHLLVEVCRDDAGQPVFTIEDVDMLMSRHAGIVQRIANVSGSLDGGDTVTTMAKNFLPATPDAG